MHDSIADSKSKTILGYTLPNKIPVRILILVAGLFSIAFGVALSTKSGLGVSPSAAIPYVLCQVLPFSMGFLTTVVNIIMVLLQILILRKEFQPFQFLQLVVVFLFGYFTDWTLSLVSNMNLEHYLVRLILTMVGCALMGLGVFLEVEAGLITLSSDGLSTAIVKKFHLNFGLTKNLIDGSQVVIAALFSFLLLHSFFGMREGTVITAFLVGIFVQFYNKAFGFLHRWLNMESYHYDLSADLGLSQKMENFVNSPKEDLEKMQTVPSSAYPLMITIEREFGSGGHVIGQKIAEKLGIAFYDMEQIQQMAIDAGYDVPRLPDQKDRLPEGMIQGFYKRSFMANQSIRTQDQIFKAQSRVIRDIANSGKSAVIVGRLGNHILNPRPNCFNLFISGEYEFRAKYLQEFYGYEKNAAIRLIRQEDHARASYCKHFTGSPWGLSRHFSMTLDSSLYGFEKSAELALDAIQSQYSTVIYR